MNLIPASLSVIPRLPIRGIYYIAQYGTSGYASAARGYLYHYFINGLPITWDPLYFDNSVVGDDDLYDVVIKSLINKPIPEYDMVIMHSTPDLWPQFWKEKNHILQHKIVNGYCTWETNRLPENWVNCMNNLVNEIWCPSNYNANTFRKSGVTKPIRVVPHIFLPQTLPTRENVVLTDTIEKNQVSSNGTYTFYSIGEWNARKGMDDLIKVYCEAFTKDDNVRLILKVHYKNYSPENKLKCREFIDAALRSYPNHPTIICLLDNMSSKEILALHSIGDCYVSLTKSEGFGLTIFDAFNYGKKVIATGYSGHIDFLGGNYPGLVKYKLGKVEGMESFSSNYTSEQEWAYPDLEHAKELIGKIYNT